MMRNYHYLSLTLSFVTLKNLMTIMMVMMMMMIDEDAVIVPFRQENKNSGVKC